MTLPGGAADKLGNRYETWWTLSELVRMLRNQTEAIRIEDPGFEKAEFVVTAGSRREFHQAKRSHPNGKWGLRTLQTEGLLEGIGRQFAGNDDRFVFVSGSDAPELVELCDAARDSESVEEFKSQFLAAERREQSFQRLIDTWACDVPTARERLRRIEVRTIGEPELADKVRLGAQLLFLADEERFPDTGGHWTAVKHLFRRAQVRQVLAYFRDRDHARYARELCGLFSDDAIRPHLKDLAFALLADVPNPTDEEWAIWQTWI